MKPIFAVIVKLPCLAIKYPKGGMNVRVTTVYSYVNVSYPNTKQVRRFQIKFASDQDYYTTLAILSNINCPFSESNVGPPQPVRRPTTSTQWRSGSVASPVPSVASETLPNGPSVAGLPAFSNAFFPPHSASMTGFPGLSSNTIGTFLIKLAEDCC